MKRRDFVTGAAAVAAGALTLPTPRLGWDRDATPV